METPNWTQRQFSVSGFIKFHTSVGTALDPALLLAAFLEEDECRPWLTSYDTGAPAPSMEWRSGVRMIESADEEVRRYTDRSYVIEFKPAGALKGGQLAAYHNHVSSIAHRLAQLDIASVDSVSGSIIVTPMRDVFVTPSASARCEQWLRSKSEGQRLSR